MNPFRFAGLRVRLALLLALLVSLPLGLAVTVALQRAESDLERALTQQHQTVIRALENGVHLHVRSHIEELELLARHPSLECQRLEEASSVIQHFLSTSVFFRSIYFYDASGRLVITEYAGTSRAGIRYRGQLLKEMKGPTQEMIAARFEAALRSPVALTLAGKPVDGFPTVVIMVPVRDFQHPERTVGVLTSLLILAGSELGAAISSFDLGSGVYVGLTDADGNVQVRSGDGLPRSARRFALEGGVLTGGPGTPLFSRRVENRERVDRVSFSFSSLLGGWLLCGQPEQEMFRPLEEYREVLLAILLLSIPLSIMVGLGLAHVLSAPILDLTRALRELVGGNLAARTSCTWEDEVGEAGRALNQLAEALQKRRLVSELWKEMDESKHERGD